MTGNAHYFGRLHPGFDHSRDGSMTEVVKSKVFNFRGLAGGGKSVFEVVFDPEDETFRISWSVFPEPLQFRFQSGSYGDCSGAGSLGVERFDFDRAGGEVHAAPPHFQQFTTAHPGVNGGNENRAEVFTGIHFACRQ